MAEEDQLYVTITTVLSHASKKKAGQLVYEEGKLDERDFYGHCVAWQQIVKVLYLRERLSLGTTYHL